MMTWNLYYFWKAHFKFKFPLMDYLRQVFLWCHKYKIHLNPLKYIFCFWSRGVHQKYAVWVLVGCGIKFRIEWALPLEIWVKTQGDMLKIRTKKVVFFYDKYVNSTIMVDSFYWNSIGSWIPTHKIDCWRVFL